MAGVDDLFDCFEENDDENQQIVPVVTTVEKKSEGKSENM
jgi:hypothetical protein